MRVIVEGVDAVGKSTVVDKLVEKYSLEVVHSCAKADNTLDYYMNLLDKDNIVLDRAHVSEKMFQNIYDREERLSFDDFLKINEKITSDNDIFIIMYSSDLEILKKRFLDRGEEKYLTEMYDQHDEILRWIYVLNAYFDEYANYKVVDITKPDAYENLDAWLDEHLS